MSDNRESMLTALQACAKAARIHTECHFPPPEWHSALVLCQYATPETPVEVLAGAHLEVLAVTQHYGADCGYYDQELVDFLSAVKDYLENHSDLAYQNGRWEGFRRPGRDTQDVEIRRLFAGADI